MNKKDFKKITAKQLEALLNSQEVTRMEFAAALGIGESTLRRWLRERRIPSEAMDQINTEEFKQSLKHSGWKRTEWNRTFNAPADPAKAKVASRTETNPDLSGATLDQLVDEIENRGWKVQISRKGDEG